LIAVPVKRSVVSALLARDLVALMSSAHPPQSALLRPLALVLSAPLRSSNVEQKKVFLRL